jgi:hypothetical protein
MAEEGLWRITTGRKNNTVETLLGDGRKLWEHDDLVDGNFGKTMSGWKKLRERFK